MNETKAEYLERMNKLGIERHVALRWWEQEKKGVAALQPHQAEPSEVEEESKDG